MAPDLLQELQMTKFTAWLQGLYQAWCYIVTKYVCY